MRIYSFEVSRLLRALKYGFFVTLLAAIGASCALSQPNGTIALVVTNPDGSTNNGQAPLGGSITLSTILANVNNNPPRVWQLQGAGSLALQGTGNGWAIYTAPLQMPANTQVVVTAYVSTEPSVTTSYSFNLGNPIPLISNTNPVSAAAGSTVPVTLTGTGFMSGTVILVNGVSVPSSYQSATSIVAQIKAPTGSTNSLSIRAQNPAPAGGTGSAYLLGVGCVQLNAVDPDGTNTGTARVGVPVTISTVLTDIVNNPPRTWQMAGAGTLALQGTGNGWAIYTPPATIPSDAKVTITVTAGSAPVVTGRYSFSIVNPLPVVTSTTPAKLLSGGTQTLTLNGTGFLPSMTVDFKGVYYATNYISSTNATVDLPIPANLSGELALRAKNPLPGGGSTPFSVYVPTNTITLTATDGDGINTGTADIGSQVVMSAVVTGSEQTAVNWSLKGAGAVSNTGIYTAPAVMPKTRAVTIEATLASNSAITSSYSFSIVNPVPVIDSASLLQVPAGATTSITLIGTGFLPSTVFLVNGTAVPTTYESATEVIANVPVAANASGNLIFQGENSGPGGGTGPGYPEAIATPISLTAAARLLDQTTFGPTTSLIQHVEQEGVTAWLAEQYNASETYLPVVPQNFAAYCGDAEHCVESEWWQTVLTGNDQLRQRTAFALSEMFVVSSDDVSGWGIQYYHNLLAQDAFTNWYTIMNDVTLAPAMGSYLNMVNSYAAPPGQIDNENYARENMQLFNLGLNLLNQDGSLQLDGNGNPLPAYTEAQVQAFARVYTGWTFANPDGSAPAQLGNPVNNYNQLAAVEIAHDTNPKTLLNGVTLPGGQSAEQDLAQALTNVFEHPNVPPFVCQQLIQHLVKSQPSPAYVSRVAAIFANNGNDVRGDMRAVLTAIFTDPEARAGDTAQQTSDGHLREPILWVTDVMRALGFVNVDPNNYYQYLSDDTNVLDEVPYQSPAVFNFFPPNYVIPGTTLIAPEFGLENTASVTDRLSLADTMVNNALWNFNVDLSATSPLGTILVSQGPAALVNALSNLFLYGTMDAKTAAAITSEISAITDPAQQLRVAVYLVITSSEYKVLH